MYEIPIIKGSLFLGAFFFLKVKRVLEKLYENKKIASATHNIYAYRWEMNSDLFLIFFNVLWQISAEYEKSKIHQRNSLLLNLYRHWFLICIVKDLGFTLSQKKSSFLDLIWSQESRTYSGKYITVVKQH